MKLLNLLLATLVLAVLISCGTTPQKATVNTLTAVGQTANSAYEAYLHAVLTGAAPTNDVPLVTGYYREFQASFAVAAAAAHFATNATLANPELAGVLTKLTTAISLAEGGK